MRRLILAAGSLGFLAFSSGCAFATLSPQITPVSAAPPGMAFLQINSNYTLPTGTQPYGAAPFTLQAYVPDQVTYYNPDPSDGESLPEIMFNVSGAYTDNGVTTQFLNQQMWMIDETYNNLPSTHIGFSTSNFVTPGDSFDIYGDFTGWLFTSTDIGNGDQLATLIPGTSSIDPNIPNSYSFADYYPPGNYTVHDMQFQGGTGVSVTSTAVAVPEPGSAALLFTGILGLALTLKRKRSLNASA